MKAKFEQGLVVTPICWSSLILSILDGFWWFLVSLGTSRLVSFDFEIMLHFPHLNQLLFLKDALRYLHNSSARPWIRIKQHANILPQVELKFMSYPILIIKLFKKFIFKFAKCLLLNFKPWKFFHFEFFYEILKMILGRPYLVSRNATHVNLVKSSKTTRIYNFST